MTPLSAASIGDSKTPRIERSAVDSADMSIRIDRKNAFFHTLENATESIPSSASFSTTSSKSEARRLMFEANAPNSPGSSKPSLPGFCPLAILRAYSMNRFKLRLRCFDAMTT